MGKEQSILMEQLFSNGIMKMGPSLVGPERQVGVFNFGFVAGLPALRAAELDKFTGSQASGERGTSRPGHLGQHRRIAVPKEKLKSSLRARPSRHKMRPAGSDPVRVVF
jgi:hypothetical protein